MDDVMNGPQLLALLKQRVRRSVFAVTRRIGARDMEAASLDCALDLVEASRHHCQFVIAR
jgi:hypothetical protein